MPRTSCSALHGVNPNKKKMQNQIEIILRSNRFLNGESKSTLIENER